MTREELEKKHDQERLEYFAGYEESWNALWAEKNNIYRAHNFRESLIPQTVKDMLADRHQQWVKEWGIAGRRNIELQTRHKQEINDWSKKRNKISEFLRSLSDSTQKNRGR